MRRLVFLAVLLSILEFPISKAVSGCCECARSGISATPSTGVAPLSVIARGSYFWVGAVDIDMGGEAIFERTFVWDGCYACVDFQAEHQFDCPGTYTIRAYEPGYPDDLTTTTVTVSPPSKPYIFAFSGNSDHEAYLATYWYVAERPFEYSQVDWGDGIVERFGYVRRGGYFGTPNHPYTADGEYTATITNHYSHQYCSWDETSSIVVKIPIPANPTRQATWGHVKSLYR